MQKKVETTIMGYIRIIVLILGSYWDNGKENGNYYIILGLHKVWGLGLYWENGKEAGNYEYTLNLKGFSVQLAE